METIIVEGKGEYTLDLENGNLKVSLDGAPLFVTKGNPKLAGNPAFADMESAKAYFNATSYAQPYVDPEEQTDGTN
jgi:hypothetical protein